MYKEKFECPLCNKTFSSKPGFMKHLSCTHKLDINDIKNLYNDKIKEKHKCLCPNCNNYPDYETAKKYHGCCSFSHMTTYNKLRTGKIYKIKCEICGEPFNDYKNLSKHLHHSHPEINKEDYFMKYLWKEGMSSGKCLWCGKALKFKGLEKGYYRFCYDTKCNVLWNNKNTNRLDKFKKSFKKTRNNLNWAVNTQLSYWLNKGYSEEEAQIKLSERQNTSSYDKLIKIYGQEKALDIWYNKQMKWMDSLQKSKNNFNCISKPEIELGQSIEKLMNIELQKQYPLADNTKAYLYDFRFNNKLIMYNGDYWHANPIKFKEDSIFFRNNKPILAKEIWEKDSKMLEIAKKNDFEVLIIWETDWNNNKSECINKCVNFLNNK